LFCCIITNSNAGTVPLTLFSEQEAASSGARCLDGSPAGYYLYKTTNSANHNKWAIFLEGGGWCFPNSQWPNVDSCNSRAGTSLGSSKFQPATRNIGFVRDYNYVFIFYCSGDFHTGTRTEASGGFYYGGHNIVKYAIQKLKTSDTLGSAELVILTGESAGGIGTLANFDYVHQQFPNAVVKAWSNAGWFPEEFKPYTTNRITMIDAYRILYGQVNAYLNQKCVSQHSGSPWVCYSGHYIYPFAEIPLFMSQSLFDNWALGFLGVPSDFNAPATKQYWAPYGQAMKQTFAAPLAGPKTTGLFLTTNNVHVVGQGEVVNGRTLNVILSNWLDNLDFVKVMSNCSYVNCIPL